MASSSNVAQASQGFEWTDLSSNAREADQGAYTTGSTANADEELPPPYSAAAPGQDNLTTVDEQESSDSQVNRFLSRSRELRQRRDIEEVRLFFLEILMIDYGIDTEVIQDRLLRSCLVKKIVDHFELHKEMFGEDGRKEAAECFLVEMPEAVKALNVSSYVMVWTLVNFAADVTWSLNDTRRYRSYFDRMPIPMILCKLKWDQEVIDKLVPKNCPWLRAKLHAARERKQMLFFDFVQDLDDYQLSPMGRKVEKQWDGIWSVEQRAVDVWKEETRNAVLQRTQSKHHQSRGNCTVM